MSFALQSFYQINHFKRNLLGTAWRLDSRKKIIEKIAPLWTDINSGSIEFLDIGCRDGVFTKELDLQCNITGIDIDPSALINYKLMFPNATAKIVDCNEKLPFPDETFDFIFAGEIIEHLINPELFLLEVKRILKPKGVFVGSTPNAFRWDKRLKLLLGNDPKSFSDPTHTQYYSFKSLRLTMEKYFSNVDILSHPSSILNNIFTRILSSGFIWKVQK